MRETYRAELKAVRGQAVDIGRELVITMTSDCVTALVEGNATLAQRVIDTDEELDRRCLELEEHTLELIATQSPVAKDLRLLHSLTYIIIHLERMGDLAVNIAKAARRTADAEGLQTMFDLVKAQGNLVHRVLDSCFEALDTYDLALARKLPDMDEPIDHLFKQFFRELGRLHEDDEIELASSIVLVARYLERIADHAVDIGERVSYLVTGDLESDAEGATGEG